MDVNSRAVGCEYDVLLDGGGDISAVDDEVGRQKR